MLLALPAAPVLELRGADAAAFAQAQFASDVAALAAGRWHWSAWLSAQGRVRAAFALLRPNDEQLLLLLRGGDAACLRDALARFVFRSRLTLAVRTDLPVYGTRDAADLAPFGAAPAADTLAEHEARLALALPDARWLVLAPGTALADADPVALNDWRLADIRAGLPTLRAELDDTLLPHWLGLVRLGAISVKKGCYPGQEVMARLHFKGGNKRGLARIAFDAQALPAPGTALVADGDVGTLLDAAWTEPARAEALAVLPLDAPPALRLGQAGGAPIEVVSRFG